MLSQHRTFPLLRTLAVAFATLACMVVAHADEASDRPITKVELATDTHFSDGKAELLQGVADAAGDRFELPDTDLMQPVAVDVYTKGAPAGALRLRVGKGDWKSPARDGTTDASGRIGFRFRTYDGVKFWITAETPTPYQLVVWSGTPIDIQPPSITVPMAEYVARHPEAATSGGRMGSFSRIAIGGLIAFFLLVIAVLALKRRKTPGAGA